MKVRAITYRIAGTAFLFAALWFVLGGIVLWSPLPGSMGIAGPMFAAWFVLFFLSLAVAGSLLTIAALNEAFPSHAAPPRARATSARPSSPTMWATPPAPRPSRSGTPRDG